MRIPVRHVAGNVIWTVHGTAWGIWRVEGSGSAHSSQADKKRRLGALESLVKTLVGESMMLSLCPQVDPATVVRAMTDDVDLEDPASERYVDLSLRVLAQLEGLELTGRTDWLAVPLPATTRKQQARDVLSAGWADFVLQMGLLPPAIRSADEVTRLEQASRIAAGWPAELQVRPASEAEILWIYGHAARRGVLEPLLPKTGAPRGVRGRGRRAAALGQVVLTEGAVPGVEVDEDGQADEAGGRRGGPFGRRWLRASTEWGDSYQALLALAEMPEAFAWPGSEYLAAVDEFSFPVDWVMRLKVTSGSVAEAETRQKARELAGQPEEYGADPAGAPARIEKDAADLDEFRQRVTASQTEVEVRAMAALCVWGATPEEAEARATELKNWYGGGEYTVVRPLGEQESLWYGMLPGARTPAVMAQYAQFLLARDFAMSGPFGSSALGDETGPLYGLQLSGGGMRPVLVDWTQGPKRSASASAAFLGELGGGKSVAMKAAVYSILAAGRRTSRPGSRGRAVIVDRTPKREWVTFAEACPGTTQVINIDSRAEVSLDPLRIFAGNPQEAQTFTESFMTLLLGIPPMDDMGIALSEAIEEVLAGPEPSMSALMEELGRRRDDPSSQSVLRKLNSHRRKHLARAVFDPDLPVVDVESADAIVFAVSALSLPKARELDRLEKVEYEKVFGRAVLYLIAAICRRICFDPRHPEEFTVAVWDECWWLTSSPEGLELLLEMVRDGRKHNAGALVGSHDANDIGPSDNEVGQIVQGLFRRRMLFRQTDRTLARRALAFLGLDPDDENLVELVTTGLSPLMDSAEQQALRAGECLHRDLMGRVGGMQVLIPADPQAARAIHSDPAVAA